MGGGANELRDFLFFVHKSSVSDFKIAWFRWGGGQNIKITRDFILQDHLS